MTSQSAHQTERSGTSDSGTCSLSGKLVLEVLNKYHVLIGGSLALSLWLKVDCAKEEDVSQWEEIA
jgi:hypothetical protein